MRLARVVEPGGRLSAGRVGELAALHVPTLLPLLLPLRALPRARVGCTRRRATACATRARNSRRWRPRYHRRWSTGRPHAVPLVMAPVLTAPAWVGATRARSWGGTSPSSGVSGSGVLLAAIGVRGRLVLAQRVPVRAPDGMLFGVPAVPPGTRVFGRQLAGRSARSGASSSLEKNGSAAARSSSPATYSLEMVTGILSRFFCLRP